MNEPNIDLLRLSLASADDIRRHSFAEIPAAEVLEPRSGRPAARGVLAEPIFGRDDDWECACGRLRGTENVGYICIRCDTPVRRLRNDRFGRIELASPAVHPLYLREVGLLLNYTPEAFRQIVRYQAWVVVESGDTPLRPGQLLLEENGDLHRVHQEYGDRVRLGMGAEACRQLLEKLDPYRLRARLALRLAEEQHRPGGPRLDWCDHFRARLRLVEALCQAAPADPREYALRLILDCVPVVPAGQRLPRRHGGTRASDDLNDLYAILINRNTRLRRLIELHAPEVIIRNERRMLQQSVGSLMTNLAMRRQAVGSRNRPLLSVAERLRGGVTANLLSKRVDYSARGVVVPDPGLTPEQCGVPECVAGELFRPLLLMRLTQARDEDVARRAGELLELLRPRLVGGMDETFLAGMRLYCELIAGLGPGLRGLLAEVMRGQRILVAGRRPALPALAPVVVTDRAIHLHPSLAGVLGVRFRGESVRLHLPLSSEAQREAETLLHPDTLSSPPQRSAAPAPPPPGEILGYFTAAQQHHRERLDTRTSRNIAVELGRRLVAALEPDGLPAALALAEAMPGLSATALTRLRGLLEGRIGRKGGPERLAVELRRLFEKERIEIAPGHLDTVARRLRPGSGKVEGVSAIVRKRGWLSALVVLDPIRVLKQAALWRAAEEVTGGIGNALRGTRPPIR